MFPAGLRLVLLLAPFGLDPGEQVPARVVCRFELDNLVALTFDYAAMSHATTIGPLLKKYGYGGGPFIMREAPRVLRSPCKN